MKSHIGCQTFYIYIYIYIHVYIHIYKYEYHFSVLRVSRIGYHRDDKFCDLLSLEMMDI
jgi:hypothetical protein